MTVAARGPRLVATLSVALALSSPVWGAGRPREVESPRKPAEAPPAGAVEVHFTDGSVLKLQLRDARVEVTTPYGKLQIPVGDVQRVEFATRVPEELGRRIEADVADLGSSDYPRRQAAENELMKLREKAYPALLRAAKSKDREVVQRTRRLLEKVRAEVPEESLEVR